MKTQEGFPVLGAPPWGAYRYSEQLLGNLCTLHVGARMGDPALLSLVFLPLAAEEAEEMRCPSSLLSLLSEPHPDSGAGWVAGKAVLGPSRLHGPLPG